MGCMKQSKNLLLLAWTRQQRSYPRLMTKVQSRCNFYSPYSTKYLVKALVLENKNSTSERVLTHCENDS